jgi:hypothetical protein
MQTLLIGRPLTLAVLLAGGAVLATCAAHAGPQVTLYLTIPLGGATAGHVLGMRLDRSALSPGVRIINPESPLNRRALVDLQWGADSALRLELDRRLTWDIGRQELRQSSRPAWVTLRMPMRQRREAAEPVQDAPRKPLVKAVTVEP